MQNRVTYGFEAGSCFFLFGRERPLTRDLGFEWIALSTFSQSSDFVSCQGECSACWPQRVSGVTSLLPIRAPAKPVDCILRGSRRSRELRVCALSSDRTFWFAGTFCYFELRSTKDAAELTVRLPSNPSEQLEAVSSIHTEVKSLCRLPF